MKKVALIGFILSVAFLSFALYLHFVVAPAAGIAESKEQAALEAINNTSISNSNEIRDAYLQSPERIKLFETMEMKTDYGIYTLLGSILPFLLCAVAAFKKQKIAYLGLILSLTAFFIGAAYGSHMFS
jgi:hypothetical protein